MISLIDATLFCLTNDSAIGFFGLENVFATVYNAATGAWSKGFGGVSLKNTSDMLLLAI